jgi:hypothetical protein
MTRLAPLMVAVLLAATPAAAQTGDVPAPPKGDMGEGIDLLGEGLRLFFKGLGDEMEPTLRDLADQMQPAIRKLMELIDDMDAYQMPEKLPNGDIIIRRKRPPLPGVTPEDGTEI